MGNFSANGTMVAIRKLVKSLAPRCQLTYENIPALNTDVMKWLSGPLASKCEI